MTTLSADATSSTGTGNDRPVLRFAPSPNGELHLGHALSALTTWQWTQSLGGRFLLRIEDIDTGRARDHFIEQIYEDLVWLGLSWEQPVLRQSEHFAVYQQAANQLLEMGLLYPCFATRREIADAVSDQRDHPSDPDGAPLYPGLHKEMSSREIERRKGAGEPHALRLNMDRALAAAGEISPKPINYTALDAQGQRSEVTAQPERWGDVVVVRKDVPSSYHLSVVVDDARQGVTHVTRGADLEVATDLHRLLQILLGLPAPLYHHHRLVVDGDEHKLSKSDGAASLRALREQGLNRRDVIAMCGEIEAPQF